MTSVYSGVRLSASLPLQVQKIEPQAQQQRTLKVLGGPSVGPSMKSTYQRERVDPLHLLIERVESLERKIDSLLMLVVRKEQQEARRNSVSLELDGEGVRFCWPESITVGQSLELELTLSLVPPIEINCIAEVVGCALADPTREVTDENERREYMIETKFTAISEANLDDVHRYILTTQRERKCAQRVVRTLS